MSQQRLEPAPTNSLRPMPNAPMPPCPIPASQAQNSTRWPSKTEPFSTDGATVGQTLPKAGVISSHVHRLFSGRARERHSLYHPAEI
ncbi:hypothetical protein [Kamptonema formosum]|uniref:hypothetical protein n=1 Tax=Kamptonema formosum TaxID=331992 RepID=UPI0012DFA489|nr:hypothetical protein [Oscillatoria sp. PCC 10802]